MSTTICPPAKSGQEKLRTLGPHMAGLGENKGRIYQELTTGDGRRIITGGGRIVLDPKGLRTLTHDSMMVSNKQVPGRGTRARNQAAIRIGGEQGRAAAVSCFLAGITARGLFRMGIQA